MQNPSFYKLSWNMLEKDCLTLAQNLLSVKIDKIVAISRGGLVWGRLLSDLLKIPISHITIESYKNLRQEKEAMISEAPSHSFEDKTIFIVDEIADSGKTFKRAVSYFQNFPLRKIYLLAPYVKSHSKIKPDFSVHTNDAWIIFPYEIRETYDAFIKLYKSSEKAKKKMLEVGFKNWEIASLS